MKYLKRSAWCALVFGVLLFPALCRAMPPGTLLYRTSSGGKMFGYSQDPLIYVEKGILKDVYAGHAAIYVGRENGEDYVVEAMGGGIVKNPARYFVNRADGETFLGARMPAGVSALQQARVVALAKSLAAGHLGYDADFHKQKGPGSQEWTCVGLTEKLYESADTNNPNDIGALEYDANYYAIDITPDGYDNRSVVNSGGDCFSRNLEFSKIARRRDLLVPAPEIIGYDVGLEYQGDRYIFLPYTQFLQPTLVPVAADIEVFSSFSREEVNGPLNTGYLALRWSLINNPVSSAKIVAGALKTATVKVAGKVKEIASSLIGGIFNGSSAGTSITFLDGLKTMEASGTVQSVAGINRAVTVNKAGLSGTGKKTIAKKAAAPATAKGLSIGKGGSQNLSVKVNAGKNLGLEVNIAKTSDVQMEASKKGKEAAVKATSSSKISAAVSVVKPAPAQPYYAPVSSGGGSASTNNNSPVPATPAAPKLALINRIYSTGANDWVELYNTTDNDFDLAAAGYRLEKAKTADDPSLLIRLGDADDGTYPGGTVIKAHDTYLIVGSQSSAYYRSQADALVSREGFNWTGSGYTLYLGTGAISSGADPDIKDAVGFGPDATYFLGSGPAVEITDNHVLKRSTSTADNAVDFHLVLSNDPAIVWDDGGTPAATTTPPVATSTPETATSSPEIATSSPEIATTTPDIAIGQALALQKIYSTGDNDWIEIFNPTDSDFDLAAAGFRLEKAITVSDPDLLMRFGNDIDGLYPGGTVIKAQASYLIVRDDASSYYLDMADAIATRTEFSWDGNGHSIYLGSGAISAYNDEGIVDAVGFGPEATYFLGTGPALEIVDTYILNRIAYTHNNSTDFNLIPSPDFIEVIPVENNNPDAYIPPAPIMSAGLAHVWHFNECYGPGSWRVGKWDCGRLFGDYEDPLDIALDPAVDMNNGFSLSYYYRKTYGDIRLKTTITNDEYTYALTVGDNYMQIEGLPESQFRYYQGIPSDYEWHKFTLVINQADDYWAVYIDQALVAREFFQARLPIMTALKIDSDSDQTLFDELALWGRPLFEAEILDDYGSDAPYFPMPQRQPQMAPELVNFWSFEEDQGLKSLDSIGAAVLNLASGAWVAHGHNNYAIKTVAGNRVHSGALENFPETQDISMGFWWRDRSYPYLGQADIYLTGGDNNEKKLFALLADNYRLDYWFNNNYGILTEGLDTAIPNGYEWHYLTLVYDSYRYLLSFYVDGEEKASTSLIWMPEDEQVRGIKIVTPSEESEIDDLSLWRGALSPRQVKELYTNNQ